MRRRVTSAPAPRYARILVLLPCTPTGRVPTLVGGTATTGANSIEEGALNTKSSVGAALPS
jgi:hypothetical protein